jgi:hypothetical protein
MNGLKSLPHIVKDQKVNESMYYTCRLMSKNGFEMQCYVVAL